MIIGTCEMRLRADWVASLKEKRSVVKAIVERARHKFNISIAEVEDMDAHKSIVIGFACVTNEAAHADAVLRTVARFIENNTDASVEDVIVEIL